MHLNDLSFLQDEAAQYGIDWHGPLPNAEWAGDNAYLDESIIVDVPDVGLPFLTSDVYRQLVEQFSPFSESMSFGLDIYLQVVAFLTGYCHD